MRLSARLFERVLWASRLLVLVAVVSSVVLASGTFYLAVESLDALGHLLRYAGSTPACVDREAPGAGGVAATLEAAGWYSIFAILMVFAFGLYKLFIGKLEGVPRLLRSSGLDQFTTRIVGLTLLALAVEFFRRALS